MTRIGQILVILITCFSLLFMGFAVAVYTSRTNWREKYVAEKAKKDEVDKKKASLEQQVKSLSEAIAESVKQHKDQQDALTAQVKDAKANYDRLLIDWKQAREDVVTFENRLKLALAEANDRRQEAVRLREMLDNTQEEKRVALKKQFDTEQKYIELQGNHETSVARLKELEQRSAELMAILESRGLPTETKEKTDAILQNPPSVEGVVLKVDPQGKFVEISIGSDDGLRSGHRLHIFRVKPQGKFVGTIQIVQLDPDKAVARILPELKQATVQEGDLVATRITASR